jgi:predicted RNase H-like HicB family nuclease
VAQGRANQNAPVAIYEIDLNNGGTQGKTEKEAFQNIHDVVKMIVDQMIEDGTPVPPDIEIESPAMVVTV